LALTQVQDGSTSLDSVARSQMVINHLRRLEVGPVAVLVRTQEMTAKSQRRIALYDKAGHLLINSGHSYHLLSRPDLYRYQADLLVANQHLSAYPNYEGHAYLANFEAGNNVSYRQKLHHFALERGLIPIYVSVSVRGGYFNVRYQEQANQGRRVDMALLQRAYVDRIWQALMEYEALNLSAYGRAPLVLLLEENDLTAYFLPGIVDRIREGGGTILSPQAVFAPPPIVVSPANLHTHQGYIAAVLGINPPLLTPPLIVGGDQSWTDTYLANYGLLWH
jgi:hypothetical protein